MGSLEYTSAAAPLCPLIHSIGALCMGSIEKRPIVDKETGMVNVQVRTMVIRVMREKMTSDAHIFKS